MGRRWGRGLDGGEGGLKAWGLRAQAFRAFHCLFGLSGLIGVLSVPAAGFQPPGEGDGTPSISIPRVKRAPKLSDFLTGTPREAETVVTDFRQMDPSDGAPVTKATTAYLSYDEKNLYVAFVAKDDPKLIRSRVAKRKQILYDDRVTINIDTFHDHRHAYWFDVNAHAIQFDGITTDGYGDDFSWEGLWYTEAKITADGYVVLITVPFKTLRFPEKREQRWGIVLGRFINRNNEFSMWPYVTRRKLPQFVAQFGHMDGLRDISPGRNVQFIPYTMGAASRYLDRAAVPPQYRRENDFRAGVDAKAVIKDALTLDMTLNPDFSQVESDEPQVTVNQRFEVFFPERRPFFMENNSYFTTPQNLFFSRRIVDPQYGVRLTGRLGRWNLGVLAADDRAPGERVAANDPYRGRRAGNAVFSLQRDFLKDSHVRLFVADREFASTYNRVGAVDARLHLPKNFFLSAQAGQSRSGAGMGAGEISGSTYFARLDRSDRRVQYYTSYTDRSPGFRADLGFIPRVDIRELKNRIGRTWWPERKPLVSLGVALITLGNWNRLGQTQDWEASPEFNLQLLRLTKFTLSRTEALELYRGQGFRKGVSNFIASTEWYKWLAAQANYSTGTSVNYYPAAGMRPFLADSRNGNVSLTLRPSSRIRIDEAYLYSRLRSRHGEGSSIFTNQILRTKLNYQFTREFSFRAILDYNAVLPNETLVSLGRNKRAGYDFLFTYLLHPGTALYAGYTDIYENLSWDPARPPYLQRFGAPVLNTGRQLFVKLSYLFRY